MARFSLFLFLLSNILFAQSYPNKEVDSFIRKITKQITFENYGSADSLVNLFKQDYPTIALPYIYDAANIIAWNYNENLKPDEQRIYKVLSKAEKIADSLLAIDKNNLWNNYQKGLVEGYKAYFDGINENYFSAYSEGKVALKFFDICLKEDSTFADALISEGTYDYWISEKLDWLPFVSDKREQAIKEISKGITKGAYHKDIGIISLFWILKNEKEYKEARKLIVEQYHKYPTNRYVVSAYANIERKFNLQHSAKLYEKALNLTLKRKEKNRINEIIFRHKIALVLYSLKDYAGALKQCEKILSFNNLTRWEKEKTSKRLKKVKELYKVLRVKSKNN